MMPVPASPTTENCLATVTTEAFLPGTLAMLHSFIKSNPWFQGDVVIFHDGMASDVLQPIGCCHDRVRFSEISTRLKKRLQDLVRSHPHLMPKAARFYSLETFRLQGYKKVLFCDSDLLFRDSVGDLFAMREPLVCCGDGPYYRNKRRDGVSFEETAESDSVTAGGRRRTFNVGLLLIDGTLLQENHYPALLRLLDIGFWEKIRAPHTDQVILNSHFDGRQCLVSGTYNFLLLFREDICSKEGIGMLDAKVLHFNGVKPWRHDQVMRYIHGDPAIIKALELWYAAYLDGLRRLHFRHRIPRL